MVCKGRQRREALAALVRLVGATALYWGPKLSGTEQSGDLGQDFVKGLRGIYSYILFLTLQDLPGGLP